MIHKCIKPTCANSYEDNDPDAYYCPSCIEVNKAIAKKIDQTIGSQPKEKIMTPLQAYEAAPKVHGFMKVKL
jgi:hypothetical protein